MKTAPESKPRATSLWWGVAIVFGLLASAWFCLFTAAAKCPVASVPLQSSSPAD